MTWKSKQGSRVLKYEYKAAFSMIMYVKQNGKGTIKKYVYNERLEFSRWRC